MSQRMSIEQYRAETAQAAPEYRAGSEREEIKETPLSKQIRDLLDALHLENDRIQSGRLYVVTKYRTKAGADKEHGRWIWMSKAGTPDRWCMIHKRLVFIEVKTKSKKPTPIQLQRQDELRASGAIILNVDSFEMAEREIRQLIKYLDPVRARELLKIRLLDLLTDLNFNNYIAEEIALKMDTFLKEMP